MKRYEGTVEEKYKKDQISTSRGEVMDKIRAFEGVEKLLETFDFEKVHAYMTLVNWTYFDSDRVPKVPSVDDLVKVARDVLETTIVSEDRENGHASVSYGGFHARIDKWSGSEKYYISLYFIPFENEVHF